ncbi:hypothetical protein [Polymorphospora sp. NPDC050346]|uniref:hypothetical protein n=1 Tax=Polymorphospora sp. NPDC050346 TaxID=3155780 RepID=UPI003408BDF1
MAAISIGWIAAIQRTQDAGEVTPAGAANVYLLHLSGDDEIGLWRVLDSTRRDELLGQWRTYRHDMSRTDPAPAKLEFSIDVEDQGDGRATVIATVQPVWWMEALSRKGSSHVWRFEVQASRSGWRVLSVDPHPWCGGHVRAEACR